MLNVKEVGVEKWDRFQNLSGIQFYFDTEFQVLFGHVYYANSEWALSSINQTGFWDDKPTLHEKGYVSIMSVDIGDWNTKSSHNHKCARDCSRHPTNNRHPTTALLRRRVQKTARHRARHLAMRRDCRPCCGR